jgi:2-dehydropantoate 2-reductase
MRFIIYGAGAIGGAVGASLFTHGHEVVLIARGAHYKAIRDVGLQFTNPDRQVVLPVPVVDSPERIDFRPDDVVFMTMKVQDCHAAVQLLSTMIRIQTPIICMQNGVESERVALRRFQNVYGCLVFSPTAYLAPGSVVARSAPVLGVYDLGRYPDGLDDTAAAISEILNGSGMASIARDAIMPWKYAKLLTNLGNVTQAVFNSDRRDGGLILDSVRAEAIECLAAAQIERVTDYEFNVRAGMTTVRAIAGDDERHVSSTWQSLARGAGSVETDYLNGEIVLLGRLHGIATPVNALLQKISNEMAATGQKPGSISEETFLQRLVLQPQIVTWPTGMDD